MIFLCQAREAVWWWLDRVLLAHVQTFVMERRYKAVDDRARREKREIAG